MSFRRIATALTVACAALSGPAASAWAQPAQPPACEAASWPEEPAKDRMAAMNRCVDALELAGDFRRGISVLEQIVAVARDAGDRRQEAESLVATGSFHRELSEYDPAEAFIRQGLRLYQDLGNVAEEGDGWTALGRLGTQRGDYAAARAHHLKALDCYTRVGDGLGVAIGNNNVGSSLRSVGALAEALPYFEASLAALRQLGDRRRVATVLDNISTVRRTLGDTDGALVYLREALALREAVGDRPGMGKSMDTMGSHHRVRGDYSQALEWATRALELRRQLGAPQPVAESLNNVAEIYGRLGAYGAAAQHLEEALGLARQLEKPSLEAEILTNLGEVLFLDGQRSRAFECLARAVDIARTHGYGMADAYAHLVLGRMHLAVGHAAAAQSALEAALRFHQETNGRVAQADTLVALAEADRLAGADDRGRDHAERAHALGKAIGMPDVQWRASTALGRLAAADGDVDAALAHYSEAIAIVEALRGQASGNPRSLAGFLEQRLAPYHERLALHASQKRTEPAFEDAERSKARALLDVVTAGAAGGLPATADDQLRQREKELRISLASVNSELLAQAQAPRPDAARVTTLTQRQSELRAAYDALLDRAYAMDPALRTRRGAITPATAEGARTLSASRHATIVEYTLTRQQAWVFVVSPTRVEARLLAATPARLTRLVSLLRRRIQDRDLRVAEAARQVYDAVLAPVARDLPPRQDLIIVPDGVLWDLPFQALQAPSGRYLIEDHALSYAPSVTALLRLDRPVDTQTTTPTLLALGNPALPGQPLSRGRLALMGGRLDPLPDAERQVSRIAGLYPTRTLLVGEAAREETWKAEAPRHGVLHFATHGVLDDASPMHSYLLMSQAGSKEHDDGLLEAWEVLDSTLHAQLVVLSACETARGRVSSGEGVIGLMWSFFAAGAPALVVSQWRVAAASSTTQMVAFHRAWRGGQGGLSKARAARQSMLTLLRTPGYAHPFHWAGYIVVGDAR